MAFGVRLHCWGEWACFTRPEMKVERVSYDAITPSAARGILEAIYWKPEIRWVVDRITVLNPVRFSSIRRNEVSEKISEGKARRIMNAGAGDLSLQITEARQQRAALLLRDVGYVIEAHFDIQGGPENAAKHLDQFNRRARRGACFTRPYLGCREFAAHFALLEEEDDIPDVDASLKGERDLGWMLHDIDFGKDKEARFFRARCAMASSPCRCSREPQRDSAKTGRTLRPYGGRGSAGDCPSWLLATEDQLLHRAQS
jgi:CRISPR-associated protein Cas5d